MPTYRASSDTIACTLTADDLKDTQASWQKLFRTALISRDEIPGGIRLAVNDASAEALRQLVDIERDCCRWIDFELEGPVVAITAEGPGEAAIREMWTVELPPSSTAYTVELRKL
jgi:hypothetical protein